VRFHISDNRHQRVNEVCHGLACLDQLGRTARTFVSDEVRECLRIRVRVPKCETADLSKVVDAEIFTFRGLTETVSYCTKNEGTALTGPSVDLKNWRPTSYT
jgi:hypothetical protein